MIKASLNLLLPLSLHLLIQNIRFLFSNCSFLLSLFTSRYKCKHSQTTYLPRASTATETADNLLQMICQFHSCPCIDFCLSPIYSRAFTLPSLLCRKVSASSITAFSGPQLCGQQWTHLTLFHLSPCSPYPTGLSHNLIPWPPLNFHLGGPGRCGP